MMSGLKSDCRKFSPNVFNKSKCQNCFRTKESHSAEALENNRASRNVSKCGYLFVAPDWDFNVSVNRTKRWQRRWFVLYDDGELTYALDEFPDTIPQGTIDMNKVLEVSDAEGITGNDFAISITTPDKVHFIKGTSKEESKWWFDVLCRVSPRHMSRAKHKRNATFPCGKATIPTPAVITQEYCCEDDMRLNSFSRPKFLSTSAMAQNWLPAADIEDEDVFAGRESSPYIIDSNSNNKTTRDVEVHNALNKLISLPEDTFNEPENEVSAEIVVEKAPKDYLSELEESENRRRNRRYLKRENRIQRNQRSRNDGVSKMIPSKTANKTSPSDSQQNSNASAIAAAEKLEYLESIHTKNDRGSFTKKDVITENEVSDTLVTKIVKKPVTKTNLRKSESLKNIPTEMESEIKDHVSGLRRYHSFKGSSSHRKIKSSSGTSSLKRTKSSTTGLPRETSTPVKKSQGTFSSSSSPCSTIPPTINASYENVNQNTFTRTGWLMRQTLTKDWSKHWFVLKDSSLTYYRDPSAEHSGIMDGILDLNQVSTIREMESDKYYAICLRMWDGKKHVLAAETEEFRNIWIQALQYASNLWSSASKEDFICTEIVLPEHNFHQNDRMERISSPSSLLSLSYAEEENHDELDCSSYSSDEQSEYFSLVDEDEISDLSSSPRTLPPSPPINRNVISLVKEKSRTRCNHGSKMNSLVNTCSEVMCDYKNMKNTENTQYQDVCHKEQDNKHVTRDEDTGVFFDEHIISDDYMPTSPITPPVEFMNSNTFLTTEKSSKSKPVEEPQIGVSDLKTGDSKECSMCSTIKSRLTAAQEEIRKLEKELKEAHASFDNLEMFSYKLTKDMKLKEDDYNSQIALMTSKIDDLTSKFTFAEKNYRQLKQKTQKSEGKERRRSSLKSREGLSLTKEYETKLCDLENKINLFESSFKKEPYEVDESERSLSQCSSRLSEIGNGTSESSETNTPTEAVCNENKGFFSRLQSLIAKVENVNSVFSIKGESTVLPSNPKICLSLKNTDDLNSSYELEEWRTQSPGDVPQHLENYCPNPINYPKTLSECQTLLSQKLNNHFEWLKNSLENIYENKTENTENEKQQFLLVHNLSRELSDLNGEIIPNTLIEQKTLLLFEVVNALKNIDAYKNVNSILKMNAVTDIYKTIFHTMCIAFAEYEYGDFPHVFISTIPQFNFFCPSSNMFMAKTHENSTHLNLSDRLDLLETQFEDILASLKHAKLVRYESLWNILAEVPVQDDPVNKPVEVDSILRCTTSLATDIHRIAEFQLTNVPKPTQFSSKPQQDFMHQLYKESREILGHNVTTFLDELREKCPMINECTVSFYELNESTRNNIMHLVVELSFLNICLTLLKLLVESFETINKRNETLNESNFLLREKWLYFISHSNNSVNSSLCCSHCKILNDLNQSDNRIDWLEYVKNHNYFHVRQFNKDLNIDSTCSSNSIINSCTNCDTKLSAKGQKDICNNVTCSQCDSWIQKFCSSEKQHEIEQQTLETKYNAEIKQLEECIIKSSEMHEQEMLQKQNELLALTLQLQSLKTEYEEQKQMLRNFYEEKLNFECDSINEESIKDIYRAEIEDLKEMFKEGLVAIENSHSRITSEMERRHKEEVSLLEADKQKALELEAQATLTALEAIKKSHAKQLVEQTSVIKKELMNKYHKGEEYLNLYNKYGNDLEKLKKEILKITDLYSSKCIENVDLEEKLNCLRQQLKEANNELSNLLCKNKEITSNLCIKT